MTESAPAKAHALAAPLWLSGDLPDVNVWLALAVQEHPHHAAARAYWDEVQASSTPLWFCRVTMLGLVRLLCQPKVVGPGALTLPAAWQVYQSFSAVPGVALTGDTPELERHLHAFISTATLPPRLWTDAYLAALAHCAGLRMVTFDADFQRFALTRCRLLRT
ncbi:MAG: PIN domain-containing protein [Pseudomonadota bacterium]|nr:PIN domain-containing protein [Pseudomonadota bacterium]